MVHCSCIAMWWTSCIIWIGSSTSLSKLISYKMLSGRRYSSQQMLSGSRASSRSGGLRPSRSRASLISNYSGRLTPGISKLSSPPWCCLQTMIPFLSFLHVAASMFVHCLLSLSLCYFVVVSIVVLESRFDAVIELRVTSHPRCFTSVWLLIILWVIILY